MSSTPSLADALRGKFVVANLGCVGDPDSPLPSDLLGTMTVIEIDAAAGAATTGRYHRKISVNQVVNGTPGRATFRLNTFIGSSSLLPMKQDLVKAYGMEPYSTLDRTVEVDCVTVPEILADNELDHLDFLKTDLEGVDFSVVQSCEALMPRMLCVQSEMRFQPFYEGEPHFDDFARHLRERGFELMELYVERWKYRTPHRLWQTRGRPVWGDGTFFLNEERLRAFPAAERPLAAAKQVLIAVMMRHDNLAEHLIERYTDLLPEPWRNRLARIAGHRLPMLREIPGHLRRAGFAAEFRLRQFLGRSQHVATRRD